MVNSFENESVVARSARASTTADGKKNFRTSVFGFNKTAVMGYIDQLYSAYSKEEKRLNESVTKLQSSNETLKAENELLEARVSGMESQYDKLRSVVNSELEFTARFHQVEVDYKKRIDDLLDQVSTLSGEVKSRQKANAALESKLQDANATRTTLEQAVKQHAKRADQLGSELEQTKKNVFAADAAYKELEGSYNTLKRSYDARAELLNEAATKLQKSEENIGELTDYIEQLQSRYQKAGSEATELRGRVQLLEQQLEESVQNAAESASVKAATEEAAKRMSESLQEKDTEITRLKKSIAELEVERAQSSKATESYKASEAAFAQLREQANALHAQLAREKSSTAAAISRNEQLENVIKLQNNHINSLQSELNLQKQRLAEAMQKNAAAADSQAHMQLEQMRQTIIAFQQRGEKLQQAYIEKSRQLQNVVERYNAAVAELRKREAYAMQLRSELADAQRKHTEYEFKINSLNIDIVRKEMTISQRENENLSLRRYISELEQRLSFVQTAEPQQPEGTWGIYRRSGAQPSQGYQFNQSAFSN